MLLPHALTLGQARTYVAALADHAGALEASSAYEHVLMELDRLHGDDCPALYYDSIAEDQEVLHAVATSAIEDLVRHGIDELAVELVLAMLDDAFALDGA